MDDKRQQEDFKDLVHLYLLNEISREQFECMCEAMQKSRECRDEFRGLVRLDVGLRELSIEDDAEFHEKSKSQSNFILKSLIAAAAVLLIALSVVMTNIVSPGKERSVSIPIMAESYIDKAHIQTVGVLTKAVDTVCSETDDLKVGSQLKPGFFKADYGLFQIDFRSGVSMLARAPLELELISDREVRCIQGSLRLRVPYKARGFRLFTQEMEVVDLGTEFGISIQDNGCDIEVFEGQVKLISTQGEKQLLESGEKYKKGLKAHVEKQGFPAHHELVSRKNILLKQRYAEWIKFQESLSSDSSLRLLYTFDKQSSWDRCIMNEAKGTEQSITEGALVGGRWTQGRWMLNDAVEFKRGIDNISFSLEEKMTSFTLATWVKIDSFARYNAIMATDDWLEGAVHWNYLGDRSVEIAINQQDGYITARVNNILTDEKYVGVWINLVVTYDEDTNQFTHYLNGKPVGSETIYKQTSTKQTMVSRNDYLKNITAMPNIRSAQLGNWKAPDERVRTLNGQMDFFAVWNRILSDTQIKDLYVSSNPEL